MKGFLFLLPFLVLFGGAAPAAEAQNATTTLTATVVADVDFSNVSASYDAGARTLSVSASIRNDLGNLSAAVFSVEIESGGKVRDIVSLPGAIDLSPGGWTSRTLVADLPASLSGDVRAYATVKSAGGLLLARELAWSGMVERSLPGARPLSCSGDRSAPKCSVGKGAYRLEVEYRAGMFGGALKSFPIYENAGGTTHALVGDFLPPGSYVAVVRVRDWQNLVDAEVVQMRKDGAFGSIESFVVEPVKDGYRVIAVVRTAPGVSNPTLMLSADKNGERCGAETVVPLEGPVAEATFAPGCKADAVFATLTGGGATLATATTLILTANEKGRWIGFGLLALVLAVLIVGVAMERFSRRTVINEQGQNQLS